MADYFTSTDDTGDLPLDPFAGLHAGYLAEAQRVLKVLEACDWHWTITEILEQPAELLNTIVTLKANGVRMRTQTENKKKGKF